MAKDGTAGSRARGAVPPVAVKAASSAAAQVPADPPKRRSAASLALIVIAVVVTVAVARFAQPFLVPVVAGILLSYTLQPLVSVLQRGRIPRVVASVLVITTLVGLASVLLYAIRDDVNRAVAELPTAARKLRYAAIESARKAPGPIEHMQTAAKELDKAAAVASGKQEPVAEPPTPGVGTQMEKFVTEQSALLLGVVTQIFLALLLALFLLTAGDTFRRKVARLAGASLARRRVTIEVLDEIDAQIQAYMLTLLIANVLIALVTWGALLLLGIPNAGLWAALTGVLHFIPYAGTVISAGAVGIAAFLETGTLGDALLAMATVVSVAVAIGMGLTTWMQGRAVKMNPVAVFIGVLFFAWLWGGWGLLLGLPMLAVLKSVADRVESMRAVSELLGS